MGEALRARRDFPEAVVVAGGTEVMPLRNRGERPGPLLDLSRVAELRAVEDGDPVRLGAGVTYTRQLEELAERLPVLALAARTIASRQVRNRATLGGALAIADPSADILAALVAAAAEVELASASGVRRLPVAAFLTGPYASDLRDDELIAAVLVPRAAGPAAYAKVGARNAMARAASAVAVVLDLARRTRGHRRGGQRAHSGTGARGGAARGGGGAVGRGRRARCRPGFDGWARRSPPPRARAPTDAARPPTSDTRRPCWAAAR